MIVIRTKIPARGPERAVLLDWIAQEFKYADSKFNDERNGHDNEMLKRDFDFWQRQIVQYIDRAREFITASDVFDSEDEKRELEMRAQQAVAKALMTCFGCSESMLRVFGPMPKPGVPSGTIKKWELH